MKEETTSVLSLGAEQGSEQSREKQEGSRALGPPPCRKQGGLELNTMITNRDLGGHIDFTRVLKGSFPFLFQASCLKAIWNWRFQTVIFRTAQLLCFSALIFGKLGVNLSSRPE